MTLKLLYLRRVIVTMAQQLSKINSRRDAQRKKHPPTRPICPKCNLMMNTVRVSVTRLGGRTHQKVPGVYYCCGCGILRVGEDIYEKRITEHT